MFEFKIIPRSEVPAPVRRTRKEYEPLLDEIEGMSPQSGAMIITMDSPRELDRIRAVIYHYFGKGYVSIKALDKNKKKYVLTKV